MTTLFISDLHLHPSRPQITELLLDFLRKEAHTAEALYILGDFFETWIGDDDPDPHHARVLSGVRALTDSGVPVFFMHGNRDFLIGEGFARQTGCTLLPDPTSVNLYATPTLLMHGDTLCTDDVEYQEFRNTVRDPAWQKSFLAKPLAERGAFSAQARATSKTRTASKPEYIMDVNQQAVERAIVAHGVTRLIHGHTHRPAVHKFRCNGLEATRIVLGDWYEQGSILRVNRHAALIETLPPS